MKIKLFLSALSFVCASAAAAQDVSDLMDLDLDKCWTGSLSSQLDCVQADLEVCNDKVMHLGTAGGANMCYLEVFEQADQRMNAVYKSAIANARRNDAEQGGGFRVEMVRDAQRKWLTYRDAQSEVGPTWAQINSGYDAIVAYEAAKLTIIQTYELEHYARD